MTRLQRGCYVAVQELVEIVEARRMAADAPGGEAGRMP